MRPISIISLLIFISFTAFSQTPESWVTQFPDEGYPNKMFHTIDDCYAIFASSGNKYLFYKYSNTGELILRKEFLNTEDYWIYNYDQLNNGNFVISGTYYCDYCDSVGYAFISILNQEGDTIWLKKLTDQNYAFGFYNPIEVGENLLFCTAIVDPSYPYQNPEQNYLIFKFKTNNDNFEGAFLPRMPKDFFAISDDTILVSFVWHSLYPDIYENTTFQYLDTSFSVIREKTYFKLRYGLLTPTSDKGYLIHNSWNNDYGLLKLNSEFDSLWSIPYNHYWTYNSICIPNIQVETTDEGTILGGSCSYGYQQSTVFLVKLDKFGNKQWDRSYPETIVDHVSGILQAFDGGYVLLESSGYNQTMWLVKTNSIGILNNTEIIKNIVNQAYVFPNPACDLLNFCFQNSFRGEISFVNAIGIVQKSVICDFCDRIQINISDLIAGYFTISIFNFETKELFNTRFLKQ